MNLFSTPSAWVITLAAGLVVVGAPVDACAQQTQSTVSGVVTDETGRPLPGVEVVAQCASLSSCDTTYRTATGRTDGEGRYAIVIRGIGEYWISASIKVDGIQVNLTPEPPNQPFGRAEDATRNLQVKYYPGSGDSSYGVGGIVRIGQPSLSPRELLSDMRVTLTPQSGVGRAITRVVRWTGEGWVVDGFKPGAYMVTASLPNGQVMSLAPHGTSRWDSSYTGGFGLVNGGDRHMWIDAKPAPAGTESPTPNAPEPDTQDGNAPTPREWGMPANEPVDRRYFPLPRTRQSVGRWTVTPTTMWFAGSSHPSRANTVTVAVIVTNTSPLPQDPAQSFRFQINGRSTYTATKLDSGGFSLSRLASGQSAEVHATFAIPQNEQTAITALSVTAVQQPMTPLLGQPSLSEPIQIPLYRRPASDQVPTTNTNGGQGKTDAPVEQTPPLTDTAPSPTPPPYAGPPPVVGDVKVFGPVTVVSDLSAQVVGLSHRDGLSGGEAGTAVYADLINQSRSPMRLSAGQVRAELIGTGGRTRSSGLELYINDLKQTWSDDFAIAAGQTVRLAARYPIPVEAQRGVSGWMLSAGERSFEFRLPPGDAYFRTQSAVYPDPVEPAPTPASETAMRALEGTYSVQNVGELTLRYDGGRLRGETRLRAGQPVLDQLILTMPEAGKMRGTIQRADNPPGSVWQSLDLTVSADGVRLQGEASRVHPPQNSPRPFTAVRTSAPAPAPTPPPVSTPAPSADLSRFTGTFTTSRGTTLTLTPEGGRLVGRATGENNAGAEALRLDPADGGVLTGSWRETTNNGVELGQARLTFEGSDRFSGQVTMMTGGAPFAYEGQRAGGSAATGSPAPAASAPAAPQRIGEYDVAFVSMQRGQDGDWETTWSLTNRSQATTAVQLNDIFAVLKGAGGEAARGAGPYHYAGETGRRVRRSGFEIAPGEETRIRLWHSGSRNMTPTGYTFNVRGREGQGSMR